MRFQDGQIDMKVIIGLAIPMLLVAGIVGAHYYPTASNQGYAPVQPIPYSHKLHAGDLKIPCQYCHVGVEKSRHATVPALNVCMNCHTVVKPDSPLIQTIKKAYAEGKPIEWVRIHELPDYVYFPHKRHVAKGLACETCHGDIKTMETVYQFAPLTMGWCMDCHRGVTTPKAVLARADRSDPNLPPGHVASINCTTCHQ